MIDVAVSTSGRAATGEVNLAARRALFAGLVIASICGLMGAAARALSPGGLGYATPDGKVTFYARRKRGWEWVTR